MPVGVVPVGVVNMRFFISRHAFEYSLKLPSDLDISRRSKCWPDAARQALAVLSLQLPANAHRRVVKRVTSAHNCEINSFAVIFALSYLCGFLFLSASIHCLTEQERSLI